MPPCQTEESSLIEKKLDVFISTPFSHACRTSVLSSQNCSWISENEKISKEEKKHQINQAPQVHLDFTRIKHPAGELANSSGKALSRSQISGPFLQEFIISTKSKDIIQIFLVVFLFLDPVIPSENSSSFQYLKCWTFRLQDQVLRDCLSVSWTPDKTEVKFHFVSAKPIQQPHRFQHTRTIKQGTFLEVALTISAGFPTQVLPGFSSASIASLNKDKNSKMQPSSALETSQAL